VALLDATAKAAEWQGYPARKHAAEARGLLAGRGIAFYIEPTSSGNLAEAVSVTVGDDEVVRVRSGTQAMGQGLWTFYAQIIAQGIGQALLEDCV
jgi:aerobic carbon-monoxide dehydrogenase large subunit